MARTIRDASLETRTARARLSIQSKPHYRAIDGELHLGYRRNKAGGKWVVRHYVGGGKYAVETIGAADDHCDADGITTFDYRQAQRRARELAAERVRTALGADAPAKDYTVADALGDYLGCLRNPRTASEAQYQINASIKPDLGSLACDRLTSKRIRDWLNGLATRGVDPANPESVRRRRATTNRIFTTLRAALNNAWHEGKVGSDSAWRRVKPFAGVDVARARYLTVAEAQRLINGCAPAFRNLVQGALLTGARYGELTALRCHDFNRDSGTAHIRQSKAGKGRHVVLNAEGVALFSTLTAGRAGDEHIFRRDDGRAWARDDKTRPMRSACERAGITPPIGFHGLRHTYASLALMGGLPLIVLAKNLGHADTRMVEKHYGHLADSYTAGLIRATAPTFGGTPSSVAALDEARA